MARPYDRPATITALVNALVVFLLPLLGVLVLGYFAKDYSNGGTTVRARGPNYLENQFRAYIAYTTAAAPFAMASAWRTFVHARNWLERGDPGYRGVVEAAACGFVATILVLLPGILTRPAEALPYILFYGGIAFITGGVLGAVLHQTATLTLRLLTPRPPTV